MNKRGSNGCYQLDMTIEANIGIYGYGSKAMEPYRESRTSWDLWMLIPPP